MSSEPARTAARPARFTGLVVLLVVLAVLVGHRSLQIQSAIPPASAVEADGIIPEGVTVFDDQYPAVHKLDRALRTALRRATTDAAGDGVRIVVNSGWRSPKYQEQLLREAIVQYGSEEKAARWVASPRTSAHVLGKAVDIGPAGAAAWLSRHGARYGLCQIYRDEIWHCELRPAAVQEGCPPVYADPTDDPRLR